MNVDLLKERGLEAIPEQEPVQLCLSFSEGGELAVLCSSDGESVRVGRHPYSPLPDRENHFEVVREDQTGNPQWMVFVGHTCEDVVEVRDHSFGGKGVWVGVELLFEGGAVLTAYNWGDALLTSAPPEETGFLERTSLAERYPSEEAPKSTGGKPSRKSSRPQEPDEQDSDEEETASRGFGSGDSSDEDSNEDDASDEEE